uniref:Uncharacterized protein n=1 Tax=Tanacetum cinerariifolium TaxID=118510 RepID=A0A699HDS1_TANCI|nr:hypothetical protein [Tanacetum cinerariifolium]
MSCASNSVETKLKRKRHLDTLSSVRRPKPTGIMWMKKGHLILLKVIFLIDTQSAHACNNARNAYCNSYDVDVNDLFVFDDVSLRQSHVSKMSFRKKPSASLNVPSRSKQNKSLPRIVFKWLPKLQPLVEPVAKWIPKIIQICHWIIDSGCPKHMTGNRALLTNFEEKFLGTVRFGNNDFAMIAGYGDVVIGSMTIKKLYYIKGFPKMKFKKYHLCSACEQRKIHQKHHKSKTAFALNQPLYLLHIDFCGTMRIESINGKRYVLVVVDDYSRCYLPNDYDDVGKLKAKGDIRVFVGYSKESVAFRIYNKRTRKIHESVNVNFDVISRMASRQFSLKSGLSNLNETRKSSNPSVSQVSKTSKKDLEDLFHNFYDEYFDSSKIMKSSIMNVETFNVKIPSQEEDFHESSESFQEEFSSSSLNDDNKDHPLHKIIGDLKSSVRTRGQLENSCLFSCFLSSMEPVNVAEALRDWVSAMQDELDQFVRLKVRRLVPRPEDVKTTFLNEILKEEVYVGQPPGFVSKQYQDHVYTLDKALYGLEQVP